MTIYRFIFTILSILLMAVLTAVLFVFPDYYFLILIAMFVIFAFTRKFRQNENKEKMNVLLEYSNNCDAEKYINETRRINKKYILSRSNRFIEEINIGLALIGEGEFSKAEQLIIELSKKQSKVNDLAMILYLRFCAEYFFYNNKPEEMKVVVEKMVHLIKGAKQSIQMQVSLIGVLAETKMNILNNENLESAKNIYDKLLMPPTTLNMLSKEYVLAIIDIRMHDYESAKKRLINLSEKNYNLVYVKNAKKLLEEMNKKDAEYSAFFYFL